MREQEALNLLHLSLTMNLNLEREGMRTGSILGYLCNSWSVVGEMNGQNGDLPAIEMYSLQLRHEPTNMWFHCYPELRWQNEYTYQLGIATCQINCHSSTQGEAVQNLDGVS
jgi:hypothetical protein